MLFPCYTVLVVIGILPPLWASGNGKMEKSYIHKLLIHWERVSREFPLRWELIYSWTAIVKIFLKWGRGHVASPAYWCKDVSWARCWGISIINPSKTIAIPHNESIKVPWSLLCAACADTAIVFPLISFPPKDLGLSRRYLLLRRNKSSVVPEQSVFIGRSNKSSERGGKERYGCLACRALSSAHCCASMSPPALHSFGTAKPLIAFVALIRAEVFLLGCLSFLPPSPFHLRQCIHIFICI